LNERTHKIKRELSARLPDWVYVDAEDDGTNTDVSLSVTVKSQLTFANEALDGSAIDLPLDQLPGLKDALRAYLEKAARNLAD